MAFNSDIQVEKVCEYSDHIAAEVGRLLPLLSDRFDGSPVESSLVEGIICSPDRALILATDVARDIGRAVGMATLNTIIAPSGKHGWLEDFVVDPELRGEGVAYEIVNKMKDWCLGQGLDRVEFTSSWQRLPAHRFYAKQGASIRDTAVFELMVKATDDTI